jgi:hypothetical protein
VGRLNTILKPAGYDRDVLLYYPIYDLWEEYIPVAEKMTLQDQSARARKIVDSFNRLGRIMARNQIPFVLTDHQFLAGAFLRPGGALSIGKNEYRAVVIPDGAEPPEKAAAILREFEAAGGTVIRDGAAESEIDGAYLKKKLDVPYRLEPAPEAVVMGRFRRADRQILLLLNTGTERYAGKLLSNEPVRWNAMKPAGGEIVPAGSAGSRVNGLSLAPFEAVLLVEE